FLASARKGDAEAVRRTYGRPLSGLDQSWSRRMEATAQAGGGKAMAAIKGTMGFFRPYAWSLVGILVTIFLALSFDLFIPQALRFVIDNVLATGSAQKAVSFAIPGVVNAGQRIPDEHKSTALMLLLAVR